MGEEHLAQTIHRDVSDTQEDRLPESGCNPVCVFYRVFPILLQGTNMSDVRNDLVKSLCKCYLQNKCFELCQPIFQRTITLVKQFRVIYLQRSQRSAREEEVGAEPHVRRCEVSVAVVGRPAYIPDCVLSKQKCRQTYDISSCYK